MKILFGFIFIFNLFSSSIFAENRDDSYLAIRAYSNSEILQIHMVVTDPIGRRRGYESFPIPHYIKEFSGGYAEELPSGDEEALESDGYSYITFNHGPVSKGTYSITFYGISDTSLSYNISAHDVNNVYNGLKEAEFFGYISSGTTMEYKIYLDPTPGAPAPTIKKEVTFDVLRDDVNVAYKLNQLGDDKFKNDLIKIIDRSAKLADKCDKKKKEEECGNKKASVNQLNSLIKRMDQTLKKENRKNKKFIIEEAFAIIKGDTEIVIKDLGGKIRSTKKKH